MAKLCPYIGEACLEHGCMMYINVRGVHPQSGQEIDQWGCTFTWLPVLLIENSAKQIQTAAEIGALRDDISVAGAVRRAMNPLRTIGREDTPLLGEGS